MGTPQLRFFRLTECPSPMERFLIAQPLECHFFSRQYSYHSVLR